MGLEGGTSSKQRARANLTSVFEAMRRTAPTLQLAEVRLYGPDGALLPVAAASNPGGANYATSQDADPCVIDANPWTKWLDYNVSLLYNGYVLPMAEVPAFSRERSDTGPRTPSFPPPSSSASSSTGATTSSCAFLRLIWTP